MHPNPIYRHADHARNLAFAREHSFGILAISTETAPLFSHVPFLLSDDGKTAEFHLVRSNPIARALAAPTPARLAVSGPHSYVSPDWYGVDDQVPTWNYVAVHLVGTVTLQPVETLQNLLDRQSALFETRLLPKKPWVTGKMSEGVMDRMMRQILPFRMEISAIEGTWKMSQNKTDAVRLSAADHMAEHGMGMDPRCLSDMMRKAPMPEQ